MSLTRPIDLWIEEHHARKLNVSEAPDGELHWYSVRGHMFILHVYRDGGWDVYIPAGGGTNNVALTLVALDEYIKP